MPITAEKITAPDVTIPGETTYQLTLTPIGARSLWALLGSFAVHDIAAHLLRRPASRVCSIPIGTVADDESTLRGLCTIVYNALGDAGVGDEVE